MEKKIAEQILEQLYPKLNQRITELEKLINRTSDYDELILVREDIFTLLKDHPKNPRLKRLLKKVNSKIGRRK